MDRSPKNHRAACNMTSNQKFTVHDSPYALVGEIERLTRENKELFIERGDRSGNWINYKAERDRLRAALEQAEKAMAGAASVMLRVYKLLKGNVTGCGTCSTAAKIIETEPILSVPAEETAAATSMDYGGVGLVGCEGDDGLLRVHTINETCNVCATDKTS